MLLSGPLICVVGDMQFHKLIEAPETVAKRRIFDSFLVSYHKVV